jgi:hypothetical protein
MMRAAKSIIIILCLFVSVSIKAFETPRISLITCHAGPDIYELCGHSAIRIQYRDAGIDYAVNYGLFDFNSPNFIYRFVSGKTDYMVGAIPFDIFISQYCHQGRKVIEQQLNLSATQSSKLVALLEDNLRPENRVYRYNYVLNNCATRCIDIIEQAIGDTITFHAASISETNSWSFRDEMRHYHKNYPWYQFGIDLALGSSIDKPITTKEKSFAPEMMERMFATATLTDSLGCEYPLVDDTTVIYPGNGATAISNATPWLLSPIFIGWALFTIIFVVSLYDIRRHKISRWLDCILFSILGLAGCLIFFLVIVSEHYATSPNWLIVWLNPLCFCGAILTWIKSCNILNCYHTINSVALFLLLLIWPLTGQYFNMAFLPLILADISRSITNLYINKCIPTTNIA